MKIQEKQNQKFNKIKNQTGNNQRKMLSITLEEDNNTELKIRDSQDTQNYLDRVAKK